MIASTVGLNVSSFFLPPVSINKNIKRILFFSLRKVKNSAACVYAETHIHIHMHNINMHPHVHTLLSGLVSSVKLPTLSFIRVNRMCEQGIVTVSNTHPL